MAFQLSINRASINAQSSLNWCSIETWLMLNRKTVAHEMNIDAEWKSLTPTPQASPPTPLLQRGEHVQRGAFAEKSKSWMGSWEYIEWLVFCFIGKRNQRIHLIHGMTSHSFHPRNSQTKAKVMWILFNKPTQRKQPHRHCGLDPQTRPRLFTHGFLRDGGSSPIVS